MRDPARSGGEHTRPLDGSVVFEVTLLPARGVAQQPQRRTFTLSRVRRIGSGGLNHIVIDGEGIAAYHAQLIPGTPAPVLVLDGTTALLNGVGVSGSVGLIPGDTLSFGEHNLRVSASGLDDDCVAGQDVAWRLVSGAGNASIAVTDEVVIGSAATSAICLKEPDVTARHAQLVLRSGTLWLRDFSGGATFVNAEPVNGAQRLQHEDVLRIGSLDFRVVHEVRVTDEPLGSIAAVGAANNPGDSSILEPAFVAEVLPTAEVHRADTPRPTPAVWEIDEPVAGTAADALSVETTAVWRASVFEVPTPGVGLPAVKGQWGVPLLILLLTAAVAIAMWTPEHPVDVNRISDSRVVVDALDRARGTARSLQDVAVAWLTSATAGTPRDASDATAIPPEPPQVVAAETSTSAVIPPDLLELQRKAAAGDAAAIKHVEKLSAIYAELASSATARGDSATARRHTAMAELLAPTQATVETAVTAPPAVSVEHPASPADALVFEARQLQSRGAASARDGRSVVSVLLEALRLEPGHAEAQRDLNLAIDSLNDRLRTLIANHRFRAAGALLAQLSRDGIRVLSNGNVRDRPSFLDARVWRSLAVWSLLVEADELIQQGLLATPDQENAIARLEVATRLDPTNPLVDDMRAKSAGMLSMAADRASDAGLSEEARRLSNLAAYVGDNFGA